VLFGYIRTVTRWTDLEIQCLSFGVDPRIEVDHEHPFWRTARDVPDTSGAHRELRRTP
jgi:hypothetical protein